MSSPEVSGDASPRNLPDLRGEGLLRLRRRLLHAAEARRLSSARAGGHPQLRTQPRAPGRTGAPRRRSVMRRTSREVFIADCQRCANPFPIFEPKAPSPFCRVCARRENLCRYKRQYRLRLRDHRTPRSVTSAPEGSPLGKSVRSVRAGSPYARSVTPARAGSPNPSKR